MKEWIEIIRPLNGFMSSLTVIVVAVAVKNYNLYYIILGMLVTFLTTSGGNVINDYYDAEVDRINHPERPIPSGRIKRESALIYSAFIFSVSIFISIFLGIIPFIIDVIAVALLFAYESYTKNRGFLGNLNISFLLLMLFLFSGSIFKSYTLPAILGSMAFFSTLGREITKDVEDMAGDFNRVTLPKRIGKKNALYLSSLLYIIAILISPIPFMENYYGLSYLIPVVVADVMFLFSIYEQFRDAHRGEVYSKYAMIVALISFVLGGLL
ncbi:MAG: prenyltransferase [Aciduliprofundum sp.]|nr:MAG: prenyltransferase [Aciduliprofundum sp.]